MKILFTVADANIRDGTEILFNEYIFTTMNKVIVFGVNIQNTLGLIRSIGEQGYKVDFLLEPVRKSDCFIRFSKYINKIHYLEKMEDAVDVLLCEYADEPEKPIVFCGSNPTICLLDSHYDELKDKFFI